MRIEYKRMFANAVHLLREWIQDGGRGWGCVLMKFVR
jgi:hypothetical protein